MLARRRQRLASLPGNKPPPPSVPEAIASMWPWPRARRVLLLAEGGDRVKGALSPLITLLQGTKSKSMSLVCTFHWVWASHAPHDMAMLKDAQSSSMGSLRSGSHRDRKHREIFLCMQWRKTVCLGDRWRGGESEDLRGLFAKPGFWLAQFFLVSLLLS